MKSNYRVKNGKVTKGVMCFTEKQLEEYLNEEWEKKQAEMYKVITKDVSAQLLAVFFTTLYQPPYNWREKRLLDFKHNVEFVFQSMSTGILGKKFGTEECIAFMKEKFNIDFDKETFIK